MKRIIALCLGLIMVMSMVACGKKEEVATTEVATTEEQITMLSVGETAKTDVVEVVLNEVQFADVLGLDADNWLQPTRGGGTLGAPSGEVFVWFSFTAKNISKEEISGYDVANVVVDYNDGYMFEGATYSDMPKWSTSGSISDNVGLKTISPLTESVIWGYISCAQDVRENREQPLLLTFTLPSSEGVKKFAYTYEITEGADTSEKALEISDKMTVAIQELTFVSKYAGNTNKSGSMAFADSKIEALQTSLDGLDMDYINANCPETAKAIGGIQANIDSICQMLIEMGNTNSDKDVETIKSLATETVTQLETLISTEFSAFN